MRADASPCESITFEMEVTLVEAPQAVVRASVVHWFVDRDPHFSSANTIVQPRMGNHQPPSYTHTPGVN